MEWKRTVGIAGVTLVVGWAAANYYFDANNVPNPLALSTAATCTDFSGFTLSGCRDGVVRSFDCRTGSCFCTLDGVHGKSFVTSTNFGDRATVVRIWQAQCE